MSTCSLADNSGDTAAAIDCLIAQQAKDHASLDTVRLIILYIVLALVPCASSY